MQNRSQSPTKGIRLRSAAAAFLSALMAMLCIVPAALAQQQTIEEVLVTADFYDSPLLTSSGSISIIDSQVVDDRNAKHLEDVLNTVANINYSKGASRARFVQVRGIGDLEQFVDPKHFASVGILLDDIDMSGVSSSAALLDINQIEFLRGPQGTRFGTSALAGAIQIRSNEPTDSFEANVSAGVGNYGAWNVGGVLSGPIPGAFSQQLSGRLAVQRVESDGYIDNEFLRRDDTNNIEETNVRGKLRWLSAAETFEAQLTGYYFDSDNGYDAFSLDDSRDTVSDNPGKDAQETLGFSLNMRWQLDDAIALETILTFNDTELDYGFDEDWTFVGFCDGTLCDPVLDFFSNTDRYFRDRQDYSLDVRLSSQPANDAGFRYVAGMYAQRRTEDFHREYYGDFFSDYETTRYAAYGEVEWQLGDAWQLTTGMRYEHFSDEYDDTNALDVDSSDDLWSGELTLQRMLSADTFIYATLASGNKPGGINTEASSVAGFLRPELQSFVASRTQFDTERVINKEIGIKGLYLDDRLSIRLAAFHIDRDSAQVESWVWDASTFIFVGMLDSTSDGENYGIELETNFLVNDSLELFAALGILRTELDALTVFDQNIDDFVIVQDRDQAKAPEYQFNVGASLQLTARLSARLELEGRDESYYGYYHAGQIDSYELVNASLTYAAEQFEVRLWGRNLTDEDYAVHGLYFGNDPRNGWVPESYYQYGEPLVFGVSMRYHLD